MNKKQSRFFASLNICAMLLLATTAMAASDNSVVKPSADDYAAARLSKVTRHVKPSRTAFGMSERGRHDLHANPSKLGGGHSSDQERFPGDLQFHGGQVVDAAESHPIFLRPNGVCPIATCWGDPETFLIAYGKSQLSHVTDQYVGLHHDNRYTLGAHAFIDFTPSSKPFTDNDIQAFVHAVASSTGNVGYGHIYHVFLPPGTDECFDSTFSACYSPDNLSTFAFCAYHSSADFKDIGHVLYTVEPFQNVGGCQDVPGTPNGQLVDATNDTLSHETTETITDPDGDAWWNSVGLGMFGEEIGDECIFITPDGFAIPNLFTVDGKKFAAQPEYSNEDHGCVIAP